MLYYVCIILLNEVYSVYLKVVYMRSSSSFGSGLLKLLDEQ